MHYVIQYYVILCACIYVYMGVSYHIEYCILQVYIKVYIGGTCETLLQVAWHQRGLASLTGRRS